MLDVAISLPRFLFQGIASLTKEQGYDTKIRAKSQWGGDGFGCDMRAKCAEMPMFCAVRGLTQWLDNVIHHSRWRLSAYGWAEIMVKYAAWMFLRKTGSQTPLPNTGKG